MTKLKQKVSDIFPYLFFGAKTWHAMVHYVQDGDAVLTTACFVKRSWTFTDLIPYVFINNSDDSISMTRGASSLEDYF